VTARVSRVGSFFGLFVVLSSSYPPPSIIYWPEVCMPEGIVCLNHPPSLDLSRVGGPDSVFAPAHSHIVTDQQAGWHQTVTIPVTSLDAWNEIAAARSLTKVRELQAAGRLGSELRPISISSSRCRGQIRTNSDRRFSHDLP
jgi:hypothetical protein